MYYPSSENKGADQLRGYREADLRLCFRLCRLLVFPRGGSNVIVDNCPLGDQPGVLSDRSQTCADYVADNPYRCYPEISSYVSKSCCESCAAIYTGVQGVLLCIFYLASTKLLQKK